MRDKHDQSIHDASSRQSPIAATYQIPSHPGANVKVGVCFGELAMRWRPLLWCWGRWGSGLNAVEDWIEGLNRAPSIARWGCADRSIDRFRRALI